MTYRQLHKRANILDDIKNGADKAWKSYNDYADKHSWVRPTAEGLAGAGIGAGLGSLGFLINPKTAKTLMFLLGGLGGLRGFKHGILSNPYFRVQRLDQEATKLDEKAADYNPSIQSTNPIQAAGLDIKANIQRIKQHNRPRHGLGAFLLGQPEPKLYIPGLQFLGKLYKNKANFIKAKAIAQLRSNNELMDQQRYIDLDWAKRINDGDISKALPDYLRYMRNHTDTPDLTK